MNPPTDADIFALMATRAEKYCPLFGEHKSIPCICGYPSDAQLAVRRLLAQLGRCGEWEGSK